MPIYEIFSHSDRYHYRWKIFSYATCFLILCTILTFLPPILFAYYSEGFWIKESRYTEQPRINYSSKYILITENSGQSNPYFSSSYASINTIFQNSLIPTTNTYQTIDNNHDGIIDQLLITLQSPFPSTAQITNINLWLIFQYELRARQSIIMETMLAMNLNPPDPSLPVSNNPSVTLAGDLILEQRQPIQSSGSDLTYNTSIIDLNNLIQSSSLNLSNVLDEYFTRKYYTTFQTEYTKWMYGTVSTTDTLTINLKITIGKQSIRFIPGFWQEFKWGWIQYVCVLLPFIAVFNRIKEFVYRKQFLRTLVEVPHHYYKDK